MDERADSLHPNPWDEFATEFASFVARREQQDLERDPILMEMLPLLGDIRGKRVLDACCGEGFFSRVIASRGALVTGIDLSPRLIEIARQKDSNNTIEYRVADLSQRLPELEGNFDHIGSHLALNDVDDYREFAANLAVLVKPRGRIVIALNNPYSLVVRGHITDYFESGARGLYGGLSQLGVQARSYHRTLESYLDAFFSSGLRLIKLVDVLQDRLGREWLLPKECRFPLFMILAFEKPIEDVLA